MARYFFKIIGAPSADEVAYELRNDEDAKGRAVVIAAELARGNPYAPTQSLVVTNERGEVLYEVPLVRH